MADAGHDTPDKPRGADRRASDRRAADAPHEGPDRRRGERRTRAERRGVARTRLAP